MGRKFVDAIWIRSRMNRADARHEADLRRRRAAFHQLLTDPTTGPRLDAMLADNARIDAAAVVVDVELVPVSRNRDNAVVDVALVPKKDGGQ